MTLLAALPLLLLGPDPQLPTMQQAEDALLYAWTCTDEDGFTLCDPSFYPRDIEFTHFSCRPEPPSRGERVRATCEFAGRVQRLGLRREKIWKPIPVLTAAFWIDDRGGPATWRTQR